MRIPVVLVTSLALASGCGDNHEVPVVETLCAPTPPPAPVQGPFTDPLALPLPTTCVEGGLRDLPGRWFVIDPTQQFSFFYPRFEGSCATGFRRVNWREDDLELGENDATFHTWSDGTRVYTRDYFRFEFGDDVYEFSTAVAACLRADGTLAVVQADFDSDRGERFSDLTGTRFVPRDTGADGLALVGALRRGTDDSPIIGYNVALDGDLAVVAGPLGLDVIDVSVPTAPAHLRHIAGTFNDVKLVRGASSLVAYAAPMNNDYTSIIDLTTPSTASIVGQINAYSHSLFVTPATTPPRLYLANYTGGIPVFDVTDPLIPVRQGSIGVPGEGEVGIHDLHVSGDRVYVNKTTEGVVAMDVSAGIAAPVELGRLDSAYSHASWPGTAGGREILIHGDEGMTPDGGALLRVLDAEVASPTFMQEIGRFATRAEVGIHNILLVGDKAYIAYYQDGVRVVDLSDPTAPREVGRYNTWDPETASGAAFEGAIGLAVVGDLIYVADSELGLVILRDTTP